VIMEGIVKSGRGSVWGKEELGGNKLGLWGFEGVPPRAEDLLGRGSVALPSFGGRQANWDGEGNGPELKTAVFFRPNS